MVLSGLPWRGGFNSNHSTPISTSISQSRPWGAALLRPGVGEAGAYNSPPVPRGGLRVWAMMQ